MYEEQEGYESQPMPQPFNEHASEGALRYQIDSQEIIDDIEHALKAEVPMWDEQTKGMVWKIPPGVKPLINERGINSITTILRSRLTKIFILSDLDEAQIYDLTVKIGENVIDDLYYNWEVYGVRDTASASIIVDLVADTVFATLRKAKMGNYLKFLSTTQTINEIQHRTMSERPQAPGGGPQADSMMQKLFGGRKKRYG